MHVSNEGMVRCPVMWQQAHWCPRRLDCWATVHCCRWQLRSSQDADACDAYDVASSYWGYGNRRIGGSDIECLGCAERCERWVFMRFDAVSVQQSGLAAVVSVQNMYV